MVERSTNPPVAGRRRRPAAPRLAPASENAEQERRAPASPGAAELQAHLGVLRTTLEEVLARVRSRLVARLERLEQAAASPDLPPSLADDMCAEIVWAGISARKGRVKDLVRLRKLLVALCEELERGPRP